MKIGLTFSGGGYRAGCFGLGTLVYLDQLLLDGKPLREHVIALSTVSGGTITGARYAVGLKRGESMLEIYRDLYSFYHKYDLTQASLQGIVNRQESPDGKVNSLINAFADLYDRHLFSGARFGLLMDAEQAPPSHLRHFSFNSTEFDTGKQFRFQWSEKRIGTAEGEPSHALIGNWDRRIAPKIAKEIRMGDILAASSCFPGGFEPINFPNDFSLGEHSELQDPEIYPVGLMDGGIADNQGIEPILHANTRMKKNTLAAQVNSEDQDAPKKDLADLPHEFDLVMVSDVCSPYMEGYTASRPNKSGGWRDISLLHLGTTNLVLMLLSVLGLCFGLRAGFMPLVIGCSSLLTLTLITFLVQVLVLYSLVRNQRAAHSAGSLDPERIAASKIDNNPGDYSALIRPLLWEILQLRLGTLIMLLSNRGRSVLKLTGDVFLKVIRRLRYNQLYEDPGWRRSRLIMNAIYELRPGERKLLQKIRQQRIAPVLIPSELVQANSKTAAGMGTTLWFTAHEKKRGLMDMVIACGQYNTCWNLLEYLHKIRATIKTADARHEALALHNLTEGHRAFLECEAQLMQDWERFQEDPLWLVRGWNAAMIQDLLPGGNPRVQA